METQRISRRERDLIDAVRELEADNAALREALFTVFAESGVSASDLGPALEAALGRKGRRRDMGESLHSGDDVIAVGTALEFIQVGPDVPRCGATDPDRHRLACNQIAGHVSPGRHSHYMPNGTSVVWVGN